MVNGLSREELFARVWERPVKEVAKELGISDVALAKRCRALQVPTPPRGYWARVRSNQQVERPPLAAFIEGLQEARTQSAPDALARLTAVQWGLLKKALSELESMGTDITDCRCPGYEVREMSRELATEVILHVQRNFPSWVPEGASWQREFAVHACSGGLIMRLLPIAKKHILALREKLDRASGDHGSGRVLVRVTPALLQNVAALLALVRKNRLDWVVRRLQEADYAWGARYLSGPSGADGAVTQLCVSETEFWFRGQCGWRPGEDEIETEHVRLSDLVPIELLEPDFFEGLTAKPKAHLSPYEGRLRAIEFADHLYSTLSESSYEIERALPTETIALVERLWFGTGEEGTFARQRRQYEKFQEALDRWESIIDEEKEVLAKEVLGIGKGDHVTFTTARGVMKLRVTGIFVCADKEEVRFGVHGTRYNKDGLLGQRQESIYFTVARRPL